MTMIIPSTLFDTLPPSAIIDVDGIIIQTNAAWVQFGIENGIPDDVTMVSMNYLSVCEKATGIDATEAPNAFKGIRKVIDGTIDEFNLEYPCHSPTEQHWFNMRVTRFTEDEDIRILIMHEGITRWKLVEEQLQTARDELEQRVKERTTELSAANEEVRHFAYIVSHDLRAPLVNVQGFVAELQESLQLIEKATTTLLPHLDEPLQEEITYALKQDIPEAFEFITSAVTRMDHYIAAILQLSRFGRTELHMEEVDLDDLVEEVLKSFAHQIVEREIMIAIGGLPTVVADRTAMQQIFGNIIHNAILYIDAERSGEIEICGEYEDNGSVMVSIRDNGRGIAEEDRHKVFQPFKRAGKQDIPGEGMGLPYVQALVRRHGGDIRFKSELDKGTTFTFTIPKQSLEHNHSEVS